MSPYGDNVFGYQMIKASINQVWKSNQVVVAPGKQSFLTHVLSTCLANQNKCLVSHLRSYLVQGLRRKKTSMQHQNGWKEEMCSFLLLFKVSFQIYQKWVKIASKVVLIFTYRQFAGN